MLPHGAVIHTTKGDITLKLFPEECPKTIENFSTHAKNGYYDGIIFHRVIKGFMVQTGDPLGMPQPAFATEVVVCMRTLQADILCALPFKNGHLCISRNFPGLGVRSVHCFT